MIELRIAENDTEGLSVLRQQAGQNPIDSGLFSEFTGIAVIWSRRQSSDSNELFERIRDFLGEMTETERNSLIHQLDSFTNETPVIGGVIHRHSPVFSEIRFVTVGREFQQLDQRLQWQAAKLLFLYLAGRCSTPMVIYSCVENEPIRAFVEAVFTSGRKKHLIDTYTSIRDSSLKVHVYGLRAGTLKERLNRLQLPETEQQSEQQSSERQSHRSRRR